MQVYAGRVDQEIEVEVDSPTSDERSEDDDMEIIDELAEGCSPFDGGDGFPIGINWDESLHVGHRALSPQAANEVAIDHDDCNEDDDARFRRDLSEESLEIVDYPEGHENGCILRFERRNAAADTVVTRQNGDLQSSLDAGLEPPSTAQREYAQDLLRVE